ncbi:pyridoxamine 5'-phosphate oxidase family protein [Streptomyces sp. 7N604]|uniref:pyridoxamine 5'-phosphate oxidase family protein n=1 Tax=Streptomyces sp. 7N604 TaxID=3457415 RepID=UPI003FCFB34E
MADTSNSTDNRHDRHDRTADHGPPRPAELSRAEALMLLGSVPIGRVVFSHEALPAVRPVNHIVDDDCVIIRTHSGAALLGPAQDGAVVAYQADELDPVRRSGWSVAITGVATLVRDYAEQQRYCDLLRPWIGGEMEYAVRITTDLVTGWRIGPAAAWDGQ